MEELVLVIWRDAEHEFGWQDGNDDVEVEVPEVRSVGWLLKKSRTGIKICQTLASDNHAQTLTIPKAMIKSIITLPLPAENK